VCIGRRAHADMGLGDGRRVLVRTAYNNAVSGAVVLRRSGIAEQTGAPGGTGRVPYPIRANTRFAEVP